jgi:hypothetical protein
LLTRTFAIRTGNNGRVNVQESVIVKKIVRRVRHGVTDPHGGRMDATTRSQVSVLTHVFERVLLLGHRVELAADFGAFGVATVHGTKQLTGRHLQFHSLPITLTGN